MFWVKRKRRSKLYCKNIYFSSFIEDSDLEEFNQKLEKCREGVLLKKSVISFHVVYFSVTNNRQL